MFPPMMKRSLRRSGKPESSLTAMARFVRGPRATSDTCGTNKNLVFVTNGDEAQVKWPNRGGFSNLVRGFRHQSDHGVDGVFFLDLLPPVRVAVFKDGPQAVAAEVILRQFCGPDERAAQALEHRDLGKCLNHVPAMYYRGLGVLLIATHKISLFHCIEHKRHKSNLDISN